VRSQDPRAIAHTDVEHRAADQIDRLNPARSSLVPAPIIAIVYALPTGTVRIPQRYIDKLDCSSHMSLPTCSDLSSRLGEALGIGLGTRTGSVELDRAASQRRPPNRPSVGADGHESFDFDQ
jgi:hypothetical protein